MKPYVELSGEEIDMLVSLVSNLDPETITSPNPAHQALARSVVYKCRAFAAQVKASSS